MCVTTLQIPGSCNHCEYLFDHLGIRIDHLGFLIECVGSRVRHVSGDTCCLNSLRCCSTRSMHFTRRVAHWEPRLAAPLVTRSRRADSPLDEALNHKDHILHSKPWTRA